MDREQMQEAIQRGMDILTYRELELLYKWYLATMRNRIKRSAKEENAI